MLHSLSAFANASGGWLRLPGELTLNGTIPAVLCVAALTLGLAQRPASAPAAVGKERHLRNIRQLTSGGENAEAYFSADGSRLIFQSTRDGYRCDQIYTAKLDGTDLQCGSTSAGRTAGGYFSRDRT